MKKMGKIVAGVVVAAACVTTAAAFSACGGVSVSDVNGTYTVSYTTEEVSGNLSHNGYLVALSATETNTLVLTDGDYTYTKAVSADAAGVSISYVYTGTYTYDGETVTLAVPTGCDFSENWGTLADLGYFTNTSGTINDTVYCTSSDSHNPLHFFNTEYYIDSSSVTTQNVTVSGTTLSYPKAASSDDE